MSCDTDERLARAALCRVGEPDDELLRTLVVECGPVDAWRLLRQRDQAAGRLAAWAARVAETDPERDLARLDRVGGRLLCPGDPEWPEVLDDLDAAGAFAPYALWVRGSGDLATTTRDAVSIVGARAATSYGTHVAGDLAASLADAAVGIVSGGAYGIDAAAHRGALAVDGATVVVLACGVDVVYPRGHATLVERVLERGLVVSEAPPGGAAMRHRFLTRNRLIAALGGGTVVVEAAARSGAVNTASHAERLSRPVMAVPGSVRSGMSVGCHALIRDRGAILVTSAPDVLAAIRPLGSVCEAAPRGPEHVRDALPDEARRLLDAVPAVRAVSTVRVAVTAGVDPRRATGGLAELAARGLVERGATGWRLSPALRRALASAHAG